MLESGAGEAFDLLEERNARVRTNNDAAFLNGGGGLEGRTIERSDLREQWIAA